MKTTLLSVLALVAASGCATAYTHIEKIGDRTYLLTRVRGGMVPSGSLHRCTAESDTRMRCEVAATPSSMR